MTDEFTIKAREHSYRARSAFKLLEINDKYNFLKPGIILNLLFIICYFQDLQY